MIAILPLIIAFIFSQILGIVWYSKSVFGATWARNAFPGKAWDDITASSGNGVVSWAVTALGNVVMATILCYLLGEVIAVQDMYSAFKHSSVLALLAVVVQIPQYVHERRSKTIFLVNVGYTAVAVIVCGMTQAALTIHILPSWHLQLDLLRQMVCLSLLVALPQACHYAFEGKSLEHYLINAGFDVVVVASTVAIIAFFGN